MALAYVASAASFAALASPIQDLSGALSSSLGGKESLCGSLGGFPAHAEARFAHRMYTLRCCATQAPACAARTNAAAVFSDSAGDVLRRRRHERRLARLLRHRRRRRLLGRRSGRRLGLARPLQRVGQGSQRGRGAPRPDGDLLE